MGATARERLRGIEWQRMGLRAQLDGFGDHPAAEGGHRAALEQQMAELGIEHRRVQREVLREQEVRMSRDKAREHRKAFRRQFEALAQRYVESQSERFPPEYREQEGRKIKQEMVLAETRFNREMLLWHHGQRVEAARLRQQDPPLDAAGETRRLREQLESDALAKQYPSKVQAQNFLIPQARAALDGGNVERARVYFEAARLAGTTDGVLERDLNVMLDRVVPHRHQAIELEVMAADEMELARRDVASALLTHEGIGTQAERIRASNIVQMADYKREREAPVLKEQHGIELPPAD